MVQVALRAVVLTSLIGDSLDHVWAICEALEGWSLLLQVIVFIFMDAMTAPAPKLRIVCALVLTMRFCSSFIKRTVAVYPPEQLALLPQDGFFRGLGSSSKQSFVRSIDWTVLAMLGSSIVSVLLYPRELAVVRLRCDVLAYMNWRDHYVRRMAVRAHRRDNELADSMTMLRTRIGHTRHKLHYAVSGRLLHSMALRSHTRRRQPTCVRRGKFKAEVVSRIRTLGQRDDDAACSKLSTAAAASDAPVPVAAPATTAAPSWASSLEA